MAQTVIRGAQILNNTVQRQDLDTSSVGQAVVTKIVQGSGITLSSTGADSGTGDVTVSGDPTTIWKGFIAKSAAYTLLSADSGKYIICSGGSWTLTLPAPALGLVFQVRNDQGITGTTGTITLSPTGGTIDGFSSIALLPQQECTLITDGTNWRTYGLKREVILGTQTITNAATGSVLLPVGYSFFELNWTGLKPVTDTQSFLMQLSTNSGSTWVAGTAYYYSFVYNSSATAAAASSASSVAFAQIGAACSNAALYNQVKMTLNPANNQHSTFISDSESWYITGNYVFRAALAGFMVPQGVAVNALQYYFNSGNIANSFLTVKGVV